MQNIKKQHNKASSFCFRFGKIKNTVHDLTQLIPLTGILLLMLGLAQCKSGNKNKANDSIQGVDTTTVQTPPASDTTTKSPVLAKKDSVGTISFLLPSPDEILSEIFGGKVILNAQLPNPKENSEKYLNRKKLALNLGVYIADFAYLNLNDNKSGALAYFKVIREMAQKVNIYGLFNEDILNRLENNLTNKDSLGVISKEIYYNMLTILESSNRNNIYALIASGALVESLYLSAMIVTDYKSYQVVAEKIFEQKYVLANFYDFASQYASDPDVGSVLVKINSLKNILQGSNSKTTKKIVKKLNKGQVEIEGGEDIIVTESNFKTFKDNVIKIRQDIISTAR